MKLDGSPPSSFRVPFSPDPLPKTLSRRLPEVGTRLCVPSSTYTAMKQPRATGQSPAQVTVARIQTRCRLQVFSPLQTQFIGMPLSYCRRAIAYHGRAWSFRIFSAMNPCSVSVSASTTSRRAELARRLDCNNPIRLRHPIASKWSSRTGNSSEPSTDSLPAYDGRYDLTAPFSPVYDWLGCVLRRRVIQEALTCIRERRSPAVDGRAARAFPGRFSGALTRRQHMRLPTYESSTMRVLILRLEGWCCAYADTRTLAGDIGQLFGTIYKRHPRCSGIDGSRESGRVQARGKFQRTSSPSAATNQGPNAITGASIREGQSTATYSISGGSRRSCRILAYGAFSGSCKRHEIDDIPH
ncbi:hypothetical protein NUW54_g13047 [Trametes sanguinea]|uniref:Uncharacterized protein n=1 Tax=Trametes sanguinea TaxID=158606 RepID=A0ACC1MQX3_9APHY|nr:hypothetical protein NUW54_g13047 [Trametes sanguinea]